MKTYNSLKEVEADIVNNVLKVDDDIKIAFDGFDIDADIICYDIYAEGRSIKAWDINAFHIIADDISYYGVCVAYGDISCTSIEGGKVNSKHFCLDGEITIREEEEEEDIVDELKELKKALERIEKTLKKR